MPLSEKNQHRTIKDQSMIGYEGTSSLRFSDIFSADFVPLMEEYAHAVEKALRRYDTVVFVARKAVLLYYAMLANGEVGQGGERARVISSRALDYGLAGELGSTVVCDDVIVHGHSAEGTLRQLTKKGSWVDYLLVAAADPKLVRARFAPTLVAAVCELESEDVYRLAQEVVEYVQASGVSLNTDFPILHCPLDERALFGAFDTACWADLTTTMQSRYQIISRTVLFDATAWLLGLDISRCEAVAKVRVILRPNETVPCTVIPIVLLADTTTGRMRSLLEKLLDGWDHLWQTVSISRDARERGAFRLLEYVLSFLLGSSFLKVFGLEYSGHLDAGCERILFGDCVSDRIFQASIYSSCASWPTPYEAGDDVCMRFRLAPGVAMGRLLSEERRAGVWTATYGIDEASSRSVGVSLADFGEAIDRNFRLRADAGNARLLVAYAIDTLVDRGVLIPRMVRYSGRVERRYRSGEILSASRRQIAMTVDALRRYEEECNKEEDAMARGKPPLHETTANYLAMIFLRWVSSSMGTQEVSMSEDDFAYEWSPRTSALCYEGRTIVQVLSDDLGLIERWGDGLLHVPVFGECLTKDEQDYAKVFAFHFSRLRRSCGLDDGEGEGRMDRLLSQIVIGSDRIARLNAMRAQTEHVYDLLIQYPTGRVLLPKAVDEAWRWASFSVMRNGPEDLVNAMEEAGIDAISAKRYCMGREAVAIDVVKSQEMLVRTERLLSELRKCLDELSEGKEGDRVRLLPNKPLDKMGAKFLRLVDRTQTISRYLARLKANGYTFDGGDVVCLAVDEYGELLDVRSAEVGRLNGKNRVKVVRRALESTYRQDGLVVAFVDGRARAAHIPVPGAGSTSWDFIYPSRLRERIREYVAKCSRTVSYEVLVVCSTRSFVSREEVERILNEAGEASFLLGEEVRGESGRPVDKITSGAYSFAAYSLVKRRDAVEKAININGNINGPFNAAMIDNLTNSGGGTGIVVGSNTGVGANEIEKAVAEINKNMSAFVSASLKDDESLTEAVNDAKDAIVEAVRKGSEENALSKVSEINSLFEPGTPVAVMGGIVIQTMINIIKSCFGG